MSDQHEYVQAYVDALPAVLRPELNERLKEALRVAWKNKWDSGELAYLVAKSDYRSAHSPAGAALYRLEQLVKSPPISASNPQAYASYGLGSETSFSENHCRTKGCKCPHILCDRGFIENPRMLHNGREYFSVRICEVCDPEGAEILRTSSGPEEISRRLQARRGSAKQLF